MIETSQTIPVGHKERGSIAIMAAFSLMGMILITGIVYDFGLWFATRAELQHVADLAAMAGGRALGSSYVGDPVDPGGGIINPPRKLFADQDDALLQTDLDRIRGAIATMTIQNRAGGPFISLAPAAISPLDLQVGFWNVGNNSFNVGPLPANAVQVTVRRDQIRNGPLAAMFGRLANLAGYNITATATAALTPLRYVPPRQPPGPGILPPGQIILPLGINEFRLVDPICPDFILLNGDAAITPQCETGWTTFENPATMAALNAIEVAAAPPPGINPTPNTPQTTAGTGGTDYFFGGAWNGGPPGVVPGPGTLLLNIMDYYGPNGANWETLLPVYQNNCPGGEPFPLGTGTPPAWGQQIPIVGFVSARINKVPMFNQATITFQCNVFGTGRSGDVNDANLNFYGTRGSVPLLVQ